MKYAIITDIHSNIQSLTTVLEKIGEEGVDELYCLGDVVGYNANPVECVEALTNHPKFIDSIKGNHDDYCCSEYNNRDMHEHAYAGVQLSKKLLSEDNIKWLDERPMHLAVEGAFLLVHGAPYTGWAERFPYIMCSWEADAAVDSLRKEHELNLCFFGHTHYPTFIKESQDPPYKEFDMGREIVSNVFNLSSDPEIFEFDATEAAEGKAQILINPGAVGQPRGRNGSSYAIYDTSNHHVYIKKYQYDIEGAQEAILNADYSNEMVASEIARRLDDD